MTTGLYRCIFCFSQSRLKKGLTKRIEFNDYISFLLIKTNYFYFDVKVEPWLEHILPGGLGVGCVSGLIENTTISATKMKLGI